MKIKIFAFIFLGLLAIDAATPANAAQNACYSARKCKGDVLNNKDAHNCKLSGGKSWRSGYTGICHRNL